MRSPNVGKPTADGRGVALSDADRGQNASDGLGPVAILEPSLADRSHDLNDDPNRHFESKF